MRHLQDVRWMEVKARPRRRGAEDQMQQSDVAQLLQNAALAPPPIHGDPTAGAASGEPAAVASVDPAAPVASPAPVTPALEVTPPEHAAVSSAHVTGWPLVRVQRSKGWMGGWVEPN